MIINWESLDDELMDNREYLVLYEIPHVCSWYRLQTLIDGIFYPIQQPDDKYHIVAVALLPHCSDQVQEVLYD